MAENKEKDVKSGDDALARAAKELRANLKKRKSQSQARSTKQQAKQDGVADNK